MVTTAVGRLLENIPLIKSRSREGMRILIEALLLAGVTIMIIGHTRAVASIEHNIVHLWDMQKLALGEKPPPHGTAVGLSTYLVWPFYERFAQEDLSRLDLDQIKAARLSKQQRRSWLLASYGEEAATDIMRENPEDFLEWPEQARRIARAQAEFAQIKAVLEELPPFSVLEKALRELDAPLDPGELGISKKILNLSLHAGKDYRSRYSLFKLLDECGLLKEYLAEYPLD
jgi:glycerol-1-phosphate dehydrogenase [NAD(P)+]